MTLARAYSPELGRWLSRDPLGESVGTNLYGYVGNNPISRIDPLGADWLGRAVSGIAWGAAGAAGGAATGASLGLPTVATGPGFVITEPTAIAGGALLGGYAGIQHGLNQGADWNLGGQIQQGLNDIGQQIGNIPQSSQSNPLTGPPNGTLTTPNGKQTRVYDENGNPQFDIDKGHPNETGVGGEGHIHEWDWYNENLPTIKSRRGESQPNSCPAP